MTERLNFSRIYSAAFLTHQEDRNVLTNKKFIAKIQVCLPTNYRLSHHHTVRKKIFFVFLLRKWITLQAETIHTENKTNNPLVFIRHYHLWIPTRGLSQSIILLKA